ncbi:MAG: hypothetical protein WCP21_11125, partial [Armatimonadota bacterium]
NWNDNNDLPQWQQRTGHDRHSRVMPLQWTQFGNAFKLETTKGLEVAGPLPVEVSRVWKPANTRQVGSAITQWPR